MFKNTLSLRRAIDQQRFGCAACIRFFCVLLFNLSKFLSADTHCAPVVLDVCVYIMYFLAGNRDSYSPCKTSLDTKCVHTTPERWIGGLEAPKLKTHNPLRYSPPSTCLGYSHNFLCTPFVVFFLLNINGSTFRSDFVWAQVST